MTPFAFRRSTSSDVRRRRFLGLFGSQTPQPSAGRGTPPEEPQPRIVTFSVMPPAVRRAPTAQLTGSGRRGRGTLENSRKKLSVVTLAISSNDTPRVSASTLAVSTT